MEFKANFEKCQKNQRNSFIEETLHNIFVTKIFVANHF